MTSNFFEVAAFTVKVAVTVLPRYLAVMVDWPIALAVAKPLVGIAEDTSATSAPATTFVAVQSDAAVTSLDEPLPYIAVSVYCWVPLTGTVACEGVTTTDTRAPEFTSVPLLAHPVTKVTSSNTKNHIFENPLYLFICVPSSRTFQR